MIQFVLSNKKTFLLDDEQARRVIESPHQLVMLCNEAGVWTGNSINKAFVVHTEYARDAELAKRADDGDEYALRLLVQG